MPPKATGHSRLRGKLVETDDSPPTGLERLRGKALGTLSRAALEAPEELSTLVPPDFRISPQTLDAISQRTSYIDNAENGCKPFANPEEFVTLGMLLRSSKDPSRRLIVTLHTSPRGKDIAGVCIEGVKGINNVGLEELHAKIAEGSLTPIPPVKGDE